MLPRDKIEIDLKAVEELLTGKSILITGAAGSIGSEMVRQIAKFTPQKLILIDQAETPLHDVRLMMARKWPDIEAETIVSDICMKERMEEIFGIYRPDYVFHAAAYKHVPMMENNPGESVRNNVEGTRIIADLAVKYRAKKILMVKTDKAVNTTDVMVSSKRKCEIYVQSLDKAEKDGKVEGVTQFVTTRFGNVLGSNGSVIPLFKEQIKRGGPVTGTHKDIIRFIEARVEEHQKNLASYEKIKRFTLLPEPFMMGCELTDTLKLRRPVVLQKYATEIEAMYEE